MQRLGALAVLQWAIAGGICHGVLGGIQHHIPAKLRLEHRPEVIRKLPDCAALSRMNSFQYRSAFANLAFDAGAAESATAIGSRLARTFADPDILSVNYRLSMRVFDFLKQRGLIPHTDAKCDPLAPEGFAPEELTVARADAVQRVHDIILHAIDTHGFAAEQILLQAAVTPLNPEHPLRRAGHNPSPDPWNVRGRYLLRPIGHADADGNSNVIDMATAQKFKGCERPFVIVICTKGMDGARLYTACTRARLGLALVRIAD